MRRAEWFADGVYDFLHRLRRLYFDAEAEMGLARRVFGRSWRGFLHSRAAYRTDLGASSLGCVVAWDARLTSTLVLWLLYVAFLILRTMIDDADRRALVSAFFGVFTFLDVPLVYGSIWWWRTQHPQPVVFTSAAWIRRCGRFSIYRG